MQVDDLKKLQRNLEADQKAWATKKTLVEQEVARNNTVLDVLIPKVEATEVELTRLRAEIATAHKDQAVQVAESQTQMAMLARITIEVDEKQQSVRDLNALIATKQLRIDGDLADYTREQRKQADNQLADLTAQLSEAQAKLANVQEQLDQKHRELSGVLETLTQERATAHKERSKTQEVLSGLQHQVPELEAKKELLERQFKEASYQLKQVQAETDKARLEHKGFLDYESRARKLLATKDRELQDKHDELEVTARHVGNRRSYLSEL